MAAPTRVYLSLGSNLGDKKANLDEALRLLSSVDGLRLLGRSSVYRTPPWGDSDQDDFYNIAVALDCSLAARQLLSLIQGIEKQMGRQKLRKWGPRLIDIDIVFFGDQLIDEDDLKVPHPYWRQRAFVLLPLAELIAQAPVSGDDLAALLAACDQAGIEKLSDQ